MITPSLRNAYHFFRANAGYIVGRNAECALNLARAEAEASAAGIRFVWENDWEGAFDAPIDYAWQDGTCEACSAENELGETLASLSGIWDADNKYRRIVEAELAAEALAAIK